MAPTSSARQHAVGLYLAAVQFLFALSWVVYVIFLPQLAEQAGLPRSAVPWILLADQLVFLVCDYLAGVMSDRAARVAGRLGLWVLAATVVSCLAFCLLPVAAPQAGSGVLLVLVGVWAVTSAALRAPPLNLIGRHVAKPSQPWLLALSMLGLGIANALAPYLGLVLRGADPRWPFLLSGAALALATLGIVVAERTLARESRASVADAVPAPRPPGAALLLAAVVAALAFQAHVFLNSGTLYQRHAGGTPLAWLAPVFWIGFNVAMLPASLATKRWSAWPVMAVAAALAAASALAAPAAGSLEVLVALQLLAGAAWAALLMSAFAAALELGRPGREGRCSGALSSVLALAAAARITVLAAPGTAFVEAVRPVLQALPAALWAVAALAAAMFWSVRRRPPGAPVRAA